MEVQASAQAELKLVQGQNHEVVWTFSHRVRL